MTKSRWLRLGALIVVLAAAGIGGRYGPLDIQAQPPSQGASILSRLHAAADAGNQDAKAALEEFERFAQGRGLSVGIAAETARQIREVVNAPGLAVGAQGFAPFWIRLDGSREFADRRDVENYRAARQLVLQDLAISDPVGVAQVQVSFSQRPTPEDLLRLIAPYSARVVEIHVDAIVGGSRILTYGSRDAAAHAMSGLSPEEVVRQIRENLAGAGLESCGADPSTVELRVKFLRLELPLAEGVRLSSAPGILAVDPMSDVVDQFSARAVHVSVGAWPNLTETWEQMNGRAVAERPCEATK